MTNEEEEAIKWLEAHKSTFRNSPTVQGYLEMAISALKDREKIKRARNEIADFSITQYYSKCSMNYQLGVGAGMDKSVEIIDKYIVPNEYVDYQDRVGADMIKGGESPKKDSHKEWWDSFYKGEVKPNE